MVNAAKMQQTRCFLRIAFAVFFSVTPILAQFKPAAALFPQKDRQSILVRENTPQTQSDIIRLDYQTPAPELRNATHQTINGVQPQFCFIGNAPQWSEPGQPEVPVIYSRVFLPPGHTVSSITITPTKVVELPGKYLLTYGENPVPISGADFVVPRAVPSQSIYDADNAFPAKPFELTSVQYRCGVPIALINIYPVVYYPKSGRLSCYQEFTLEVTTMPDPAGGTDLPQRIERFSDGYTMTEDNPAMLDVYRRTLSKAAAPLEDFKWIVISQDSILNATTTPNMQDLVAFRQSKGFTTRACTMTEVLATSGTTRQEKLRNYIKQAYTNWGTKFVLLAGDTNIVPLWKVYATVGSTTDSLPTDMPYQCLDQTTWNNDYVAEVFIGRFSAQNRTEMANQIFKTIAYESSTSSESYLTNGLSAGEKLDNTTYATASLNAIEAVFSASWKFDSIYDSPSYTWAKSQLITMINSNKYSLINHFGHSNATYNMKMDNSDADKLTNTKFFFDKSQGCIPGAFDSDCFAEHITTTNRAGCFAVVMNARFGWYLPGNPTGGSSHRVHLAFWQACWAQNMTYFGEFNEYSHRTNTGDRWDILESNLFGDPAVRFLGKAMPPYVQVLVPNGGEQWEVGRSFDIKYDDNLTENVKIELLKGTSVVGTLAATTASSGTWQWAIPANYTQGNDYKVRITSVQTGTLRDESDNFFSIGPASQLTLIAPNGGESWEKEKSYTVTWSDNLSGNVDILLYRGSSLYSEIVKGTASDGSHQWTVPVTLQSGRDYKVRVVSVDKPYLFDTSDAPITIRNPLVRIPYTQSFESFTVGMDVALSQYWEQLDDDDLPWSVEQGSTPSRTGSDPNKTGPLIDHTLGTSSGKYLYVEASGNNAPAKEADMVTPEFTLVNVTNATMSFYYHMFSVNNTMGHVYVDIKKDSDTGWTQGIIHLTGNQGDQWKQATFNLQSYLGSIIQLRFRGITGTDWCSDACLDDFSISGIVGIAAAAPAIPAAFGLSSKSNVIVYEIPRVEGNKTAVTVTLFSLQGKQMRILAAGVKNAGRYAVDLTGMSAPGFYLCRMKADRFDRVVRILLK